MRFKVSKTAKCYRFSCHLNNEQMKSLPEYYVWLVSHQHKPKNDTQKDKYKRLHEGTVKFSRLIKARVSKYVLSVYVYQDSSRLKNIAKHLRTCKNLRQVMTLYINDDGILSIFNVKPLKGKVHKAGLRPSQVKSRAPKELDLAKTPVSEAKGLSRKYIQEADRLGMHNLQDALLFFPTGNGFKKTQTYVTGHHFARHQDLEFQDGQPAEADVYRTSRVMPQRCRNGALRLSFHVIPAEDRSVLKTNRQLYHDKRGFWVNTFDLDKQRDDIENHMYYHVDGKWDDRWSNINVSGTKDRESGELKPYHGTLITAIGKYTQKTGVPEKDIQKIMTILVPRYCRYAKPLVPDNVLRKHKLLDRPNAIFNCHFPSDSSMHKLGMDSEKFQELYQYAYKLAKLHQERSRKSGFAVSIDKKVLSAFRSSLPYDLTRDQNDSVRDIMYDLQRPYQMARLLQGDVGSGKTVVAAFAILAAIKAGFQAAIMIPTTVLGEQHYKTFTQMFKGLGINIALMTGKTSSHDKRIILGKLAKGDIDLMIGTEALYQKKTQYKKLGLVVIDEQHRFGVHQRKALEDKTKGCNVLSMTATPIPRTLATAMFNAMDVSQIRTMPKGRKPIKTTWLTSKDATPAYLKQEITKRVKEGGQTFVIAKLVNKSTNPMMKGVSSAKEIYRKMKSLFVGTNINVALITGQMKDDDKNRILAGFSRNKYQVLVATSVVEVGVDIPKANNMIILDSDRYGLAQLHQLRGRVGRNSLQAYCLLIADPKTPTGVKRMKVMESTSDGFKVAQSDLDIRHGGNIFGSAQHGLPDFPLADISNGDDMQLFQMAQQDAQRLVRED